MNRAANKFNNYWGNRMSTKSDSNPDVMAAREKKRQELAGAVTRLVVNAALREAKSQAAERDRLIIKPTPDGAENK
jgi:hypothetical protein